MLSVHSFPTPFAALCGLRQWQQPSLSFTLYPLRVPPVRQVENHGCNSAGTLVSAMTTSKFRFFLCTCMCMEGTVVTLFVPFTPGNPSLPEEKTHQCWRDKGRRGLGSPAFAWNFMSQSNLRGRRSDRARKKRGQPATSRLLVHRASICYFGVVQDVKPWKVCEYPCVILSGIEIRVKWEVFCPKMLGTSTFL